MDNFFKKPVTVTITGAGGQIGYATMFRVAAGAMLGADTPVKLKLLEIPQGIRAAEGAAMELADGAFENLVGVEVYDNPQQAFEDANIGLLIGARPRTAGMERGDLLEANGNIFSEQGRAINNHAADDFRAVVVGNPANTNAMITSHFAPDVPNERFTALTRLDQNRAVGLLAETLGKPVTSIEDVFVWGNHSASQLPSLEHATVDGVPALEALEVAGFGQEWVNEFFIPKVANRGAEIISVRGGSSVASAAHATIVHVRDWFSQQPRKVSMAVPADGSYGVEEDVVCSFPVKVSGGNYEIIHNFDLTQTSQERFQRSVSELISEKNTVRELGIIK